MNIFEKYKNPVKQDTAEQSSGIEQEKTAEKLPEPVYYVESPDDPTVLVGIDVTITRDNSSENAAAEINWFDTAHERIMLAEEIQQKDGYFAFQRAEEDGGGTYFFAPMDLNIYNEKVKDRLFNGGDFENNDDLIKAFLETLEDEV